MAAGRSRDGGGMAHGGFNKDEGLGEVWRGVAEERIAFSFFFRG